MSCGALIGAAQRLAVDRHDALERPGEAGGEARKGGLERLGRQQPEHPAEGVVARRAMLQLDHLLQKTKLGPRKVRHIGAILGAAQHRRHGHEHQLDKIVPRIASARFLNR